MTEYTRKRLTQTSGPTIKAEMRLLGELEWEAQGKSLGTMRLQVWETKGGALIGWREFTPENPDWEVFAAAVVVEPGEEKAMCLAIMDFFDWNSRARVWAKKELGWNLDLVVE